MKKELQNILNRYKTEYPHAVKFLSLNIELRNYVFELVDAKAIQEKESRKWIARKYVMKGLLENMERVFVKFLNGD